MKGPKKRDGRQPKSAAVAPRSESRLQDRSGRRSGYLLLALFIVLAGGIIFVGFTTYRSYSGNYRIEEECRLILKEGQNRIRSMSLVREKIHHSRDLSKIDLAGYIQSLAVHLFHVYVVNPDQVRLETDFGDVSLDINSAVPCGLIHWRRQTPLFKSGSKAPLSINPYYTPGFSPGSRMDLILNELISNALKHAFPEGRQGLIRIELSRGPDDQIVLRVVDDGIGFPKDSDFRLAESFGLQIVNQLVGQLDAAIELDQRSGTAFTVTFRELKYAPRI